MRDLYWKITAGLSVLPALFIPSLTLAQSSTGLSGAQTELGEIKSSIGADANADLTTLIGNIVAVLLSILGIIFFVLVFIDSEF